MVPPSRRTSALTWARPMPWPGLSWVPARRNRSKDPLVVLGIDAAAIVGDFVNRKAELGAAPTYDIAGNAGLEIFQRVVDQVGEYLLQREAVADDVGQRLDPDLRFRLRRLVRHRRDDASISSLVSILTGLNSRRPSRVRLRIAVISRSILPIDDLMKPSASVKSCESCLSAPSSAGSIGRQRRPVTSGAARHRRTGQRGDPPEDVAAQFLELAGEAHDVDQRRTQIVADDIGEALDFFVGLAQVGGALVDGGFQVEIVLSRNCGLRPRRGRATSAAPGRSKSRPARSPVPEPATVTIEASCWVLVGGRGALLRTAGLLRRASRW